MPKRIVVPEGMLRAANKACEKEMARLDPSKPIGYIVADAMCITDQVIEAALLWLSENPIVPTMQQANEMATLTPLGGSFAQFSATEWQRRMFLAPEPEVPEEIADLLVGVHPDVAPIALEAYRRGQQSKEKERFTQGKWI